MNTQLRLITHNLKELSLSAQSCGQTSGSHLSANLRGTCLYHTANYKGRLWRCFYLIADGLTLTSLKEKKLQKGILFTQSLFEKQMAKIQPHLDAYERYLQQSGKEYKVNEKNYFAARKAIERWNQSTALFITAVQALPREKLHPILKSLVKAPEDLFSTSPVNRLQSCQHIIDLEGLAEGPIPLCTLRKIIKEKPLNTIDNKALDSWIKKINKSAHDHVQILHQGLSAIAEQYTRSNESKISRTAAVALEIFLEDKGCTVFNQIDPSHIAWRQRLTRGSKILFKDTTVVLGNEILSSANLLDHTRIYNIEGISEYVALSAQNGAVLAMKQQRLLQHSYGIPTIAILDIAEDGKLGFMERLRPLKNGNGELEDPTTTGKIADLFRQMIKYNTTPSNFNLSALMLDSNYQIKTLKPMKKGGFDFNAIEDFAYKYAAGNHDIFRRLMTLSGLTAHRIAKFYYDLIGCKLKADTIDVDDLAGIYKIGDPAVVDRGIELAGKVLNFKLELMPKARSLFPTANAKAFDKQLNQAILICHKQSKAVSLLWPSLETDVISFLKHKR